MSEMDTREYENLLKLALKEHKFSKDGDEEYILKPGSWAALDTAMMIRHFMVAAREDGCDIDIFQSACRAATEDFGFDIFEDMSAGQILAAHLIPIFQEHISEALPLSESA